MCTPPPPSPPPTHPPPGPPWQSPRPAGLSGRVCAHAWPARRTRLAFLSSIPPARGPPQSGARVSRASRAPSSLATWEPRAVLATFVHCRRASRDVCKLQTDPRGSAAVPAMLGAAGFPPCFLLPPPAVVSFLSLLPRVHCAPLSPSRRGWGARDTRGGQRLHCSHAVVPGREGWGGQEPSVVRGCRVRDCNWGGEGGRARVGLQR